MSGYGARLTLVAVVGLVTRIPLSALGLQMPQSDGAESRKKIGANSSGLPLRDIFLIAGQSNAEGYGYVDAEELELDLRTAPPQMLSWANSDGPDFGRGSKDWRWRPFHPGSPSFNRDDLGQPLFGPEVSFGKKLALWQYGVEDGDGVTRIPESFGIVKLAVSGSSLNYNWTAASVAWGGHAPVLQDSASVGQDLLPSLINRAHQAVHSPECAGACRIKALLWVQGEKDADEIGDGLMYEVNLENMVSALREATAQPDMVIVIAQLGVHGNRLHPGADAIRDAQLRFASKQGPSRAIIVPTDGLEWKDSIHYSTRGQVELGKRLSAGYLKAVAANLR